MRENPSNDIQDPAEPYEVDTQVETSEQPEGPVPGTDEGNFDQPVAASPVTVGLGPDFGPPQSEGPVQDPAEPYEVDTRVETSEQPENDES